MKKTILLSLLVASTAFISSGTEGRLLRFPATNGNEVVFSYAGDLYKAPISGGAAQRLTSHVGYEMFPRFSPDGKKIAFTGQYDGNTEVYLIDAQGGEPKRLTYTSTNERDDIGDRMGPNNVVMTWAPDNQTILYRNRIGEGFQGKLFKISDKGGMSEALPLPEGGFCSYSPDGKKLAYNRVFREFRTWKHYKGGMADDIWIYDPTAKSVTNVTNNVAQDIMPMWIGNEIFFISDRDKTMNIFVYNTNTKTTEKVTNFTDYDVKFPSSNGKMIVFENAGYLYSLDPATRKYSKINIDLNAEGIYARNETKNVVENITSGDISPDGNRITITARGEVFDVPAKKGVTRNITRTPGAHERDGVWSPDGKNIAYISDRTGETEIWLQPVNGGDPIQLTKDNETYILDIQWAPDSKSVLYSDRLNRIIQVNIASKAKKTVAQNTLQPYSDISISPDSRWIAYSQMGNNEMNTIYVTDLATGKAQQVTSPMYNSSSPMFSSDGKYLIYTSSRDLNPTYGELEWNHVFTRMEGIYLAMLDSKTPSPFLEKDDQITIKEESTPSKKENKNDKKAAKAEPSSQEVVIDFNGIEDRVVKLPIVAGHYSPIFAKDNKVWYRTSSGVKVYNLEDKEESEIVNGAIMGVTNDGKNAYIFSFDDKGVYTMPLPSSKVTLSAKDKVNLADMNANIDYAQEWNQIYNEAWRAYRDGFYLENMHGIDWKAMHDKYAVLLPYVKNRLDLNYVIGELIGELSVGHAYVNEGECAQAKRINMGLLGAEVSRDNSGFYRIDKILKGAPYSKELRSPLTEPGVKVKVGDYITAIDGISTTTTDNIYTLLTGKANVMTELTINSSPSKGGNKVVIKPIGNEYPLYHLEWVENNLEKVNKATGGRVGYVYIPDMGPEGLREFARYYYPQIDKEALIIDDRGNGGGNISPMVIERLLRKPYRLTMFRGSSHNGTVPDATVVGPKVLLLNKYSASDGDLFPWSFKANNIGKVIGTRSWGGIIGISGSLPYMDGTDIRVPFFTNYDAKTGQWIVENHGVDPDILIDNDPIQEQMGNDQQLNKAIEVALDELKTRQPLPPTPAPRTLKDLGVQE